MSQEVFQLPPNKTGELITEVIRGLNKEILESKLLEDKKIFLKNLRTRMFDLYERRADPTVLQSLPYLTASQVLKKV